MSLGGILLGLINIAIVVAVLMLIGAIVVWFLQWIFSVGVPPNVQKLYIGIVALIAFYMVIALLLGLPVVHLIGRYDSPMLPATYDLSLYRGDTLRLQLRLWLNEDRDDPADLDGVIAASQIRLKPDGEPVLELQCLLTLPNVIDLTLDADASRNLPRKGVWDVQLTYPGGDVITPIGGKMTMKKDVTLPMPVAP